MRGNQSANEDCCAAVFREAAQPLELLRVGLPDLLDGECLVKIECCTVCGSDLSTLAGRRQEPSPCILGHEIVGTVVEVCGALSDLRGRSIAVGDRLVWSVIVNCGSCRACLRGMPQKCHSLRKYGHSRMEGRWQLSGGFAEYCHLLAGTQCVVVADDLPHDVACLAGCAVATVAAAVRSAGNTALGQGQMSGARVLILGAGLLGQTACAMLSGSGVESVAICDPLPQRLELATGGFAADRAIAWSDLAHLAAHDRFDIVLEMSGKTAAVEAALAVAAIGARMVLVGSVHPSPAVAVDPERFVRSLWTLVGVHNYRPEDLLAAVAFLETRGHAFPFRDAVGQHFTLAELPQALTQHACTDALRMAVHP